MPKPPPDPQKRKRGFTEDSPKCRCRCRYHCLYRNPQTELKPLSRQLFYSPLGEAYTFLFVISMASSNTLPVWQPSPVVQALHHAIQFPRTSPSWFDILYPRKEEQQAQAQAPLQAQAQAPLQAQAQAQAPLQAQAQAQAQQSSSETQVQVQAQAQAQPEQPPSEKN